MLESMTCCLSHFWQIWRNFENLFWSLQLSINLFVLDGHQFSKFFDIFKCPEFFENCFKFLFDRYLNYQNFQKSELAVGLVSLCHFERFGKFWKISFEFTTFWKIFPFFKIFRMFQNCLNYSKFFQIFKYFQNYCNF